MAEVFCQRGLDTPMICKFHRGRGVKSGSPLYVYISCLAASCAYELAVLRETWAAYPSGTDSSLRGKTRMSPPKFACPPFSRRRRNTDPAACMRSIRRTAWLNPIRNSRCSAEMRTRGLPPATATARSIHQGHRQCWSCRHRAEAWARPTGRWHAVAHERGHWGRSQSTPLVNDHRRNPPCRKSRHARRHSSPYH